MLEVNRAFNSYGAVPVISDVTLNAERGELVCLLGPSGCGKTTLLRLIAGLETLDSGTISFDGANLHSVAPHSRGFGLMFQDLALFPHMNVYGNVGFGLRMQGLSSGAVRRRVDEMLELVDLVNYGDRKVHELSGGERQRVALARSLAPAPKLLMLDEPLASLDRVLREALQIQVRAILKEVGVTSIYVTHDKDEAFAIADTIVFMKRGSVVQAGPPETLFRAPATELVARSLGIRNIIAGTIVGASEDVEIATSVGTLTVGGPAPAEMSVGDEVLVLIDERQLFVEPIHDDPSADVIVLNGVVRERKFRGGEAEIHVTVGNDELVSIVSSADPRSDVKAGQDVCIVIPPKAITLLPTA
ncbi:MAG: ABC transporter ATP-binding protein [Chloroflexi bacterium]|nr:ABC transporter ATP-binding protein [Chloroflexota bacterium]